MAITATFQADFTKWNAALKDAQSSLKPLEVSAKGVQAQLKSMATSLSGANIQKQASIAVAAVNSIGGVTKLTTAEQAKLNATVTEAIAKYAALGQKAPADMLKIQRETKQAESALAGIGGALGPLAGLFAGAFTVGAISNAVGETIKFAGSLNDLSAKTGISVEALQEFKFAGSAVGVTLDDVSAAVLQMQKHLVGGGDSVVVALGKLHLTFKDLEGLRPEDQFTLIASKLADIEDPAIRNATAFELLGKTAANVLPLIAGHLDKAREAARSLGLVLDGDTVDALDNLGDTWDALKVAGQAVIAKVLVPFAPLLTDIASAALKVTGPIGDLSKLHLGLAHAIIQAQIQINALDIKFAESANVGGIFNKKIAELIDNGVSLQVASHQIAQEIVGVGTAAAKSTAGIGTLGEGFKGAGKDADKAADEIKKLMDEITGADSIASLRALEKAWNALTPAEQKNAIALGVVQQKFVDLASKLPKLPDDLRAFAVAMNDAAEKSGLLTLKLGELKPLVDALGPTTDKSAKAFKDWGFEVGFEATIPVINLGKALKETGGYIDRLPESIDKATNETKDWEKALGDLSQALANLAQISDGTFGKVARGLASIVGATDAGLKSIDSMSAGLKDLNKPGNNPKDLAKGFVGLATGILGAVSAAIAFGKALKDIFGKDRAKEEVGSIAKEFGESVSKEFGQAIEDLAKNKFGGNRQAAKIFDLDQIISQGGGITAKNLGVLEDRLHDVFSLLQTGALSGDQAMQVLDKNFQTFVDYLGGNVSPALKEIIRLNDEFGTHSKAIAQYVDAQANTALSSLQKVVSARQSALDSLNNAKTPADRQKAQKQLDALPLTKNSGAAFGGALFGIFERLTKDGASVIDTLKQIDPVIESLDKQFAAAGISGGAAFDKIKSLAGIATDEIAGPSFEAIQNYGAALEALNNAGILDQEQFSGLSEQITATYQAAVAALVSEGKDGSAALALVAPDLQKIWELQQDFGYAVDAGTQALLDQAEAAGDVGEKHRSIQAQTLDVMKHLDDVLTGIGEKFGVDIPRDVDKTAKAFDDAKGHATDFFNSIPDHLDTTVNVDYKNNTPPSGDGQQPDGGHDNSHPYATGGLVYAAKGMFIPRGSDTVPAMLTPGEFVMRKSAVDRIGVPNLRALNSGGVSAPHGPVTATIVLQIDKRELARATADVLPGEVRRLGVRVRT